MRSLNHKSVGFVSIVLYKMSFIPVSNVSFVRIKPVQCVFLESAALRISSLTQWPHSYDVQRGRNDADHRYNNTGSLV